MGNNQLNVCCAIRLVLSCTSVIIVVIVIIKLSIIHNS